MFKTIALQIIALTVFAVATLQAQIKTPAPSPAAKVMQTIGMTDVTVEYSRPGVKGRTIFAADGLVPYGQMWRTGANMATKITFDKDVNFGGTDVEAGTYAILTKPMADQWEVYLYNEYNFGGLPREFDEEKVAAKVMAKSMKMDEKMENFTIMFDELTGNGGNMYFGWENTIAMVPIKVGTEKEATASIERTLAGPQAGDYYSAATYYYEEGKDINKAYEWIKKANEMNADQPRFWMVRRQALIEAKMGKKEEAIASAKKSMELAKAAGNMDYVRANEKSIKEWMM